LLTLRKPVPNRFVHQSWGSHQEKIKKRHFHRDRFHPATYGFLCLLGKELGTGTRRREKENGDEDRLRLFLYPK
jgi:hypothetical protein